MPRVRLATENDLEAIMIIISMVTKIMNDEGNYQWNHGYPLRSNFLQDIQKNELYVAVDEEDDVIIHGIIAICYGQPVEYETKIHSWEKGIKDVLVPHRLAVSPMVQSKGIASLLLQQVEKLAREKKISYIRVDTLDSNQKMQYLLEKKFGYSYHDSFQWDDLEPKEIYGNLHFRSYQKILPVE